MAVQKPEWAAFAIPCMKSGGCPDGGWWRARKAGLRRGSLSQICSQSAMALCRAETRREATVGGRVGSVVRSSQPGSRCLGAAPAARRFTLSRTFSSLSSAFSQGPFAPQARYRALRSCATPMFLRLSLALCLLRISSLSASCLIVNRLMLAFFFVTALSLLYVSPLSPPLRTERSHVAAPRAVSSMSYPSTRAHSCCILSVCSLSAEREHGISNLGGDLSANASAT
jgi:hypothetical protein